MNQKKMKYFLVAFMGLLVGQVFAQDFELSGTIVDDTGVALPGASVTEKGTANGTQSDFDGMFSLTVSNSNATLVVSFIGFATQEVAVGGQSNLSITLVGSSTSLDEVVVTGYGSQIRRDVTGSIATVKAEDLQRVAAVSLDNALQGMAAGVQVTGGGTPGSPSRVMIRGTNSISSGTEPLWIIDGMVLSAQGGSELNGFSRNASTTAQNPLASINPNDIESIEILKDAMATSIYGSRAAGGVIIVTTKTGKIGDTGTLNVDIQQGTTTVVRGPEEIGFVDGDTWLSLVDEARANSGLGAYDINDAFNDSRDPNAVLTRAQTANTNYFDEALRQGSFTQIDMSASKGTEKASYYISGQYRSDEGIQVGNNFDRFSFRTNLDFEPVNNLKVGLRANFSYVENQRAANGGGPGGNSNLARGGYNMANSGALPWVPIFHPTVKDGDGNPALFDPLSGRNLRASLNRDNYINDVETYRTIAVAYADWNIPWVDGLSVRSELGYDWTNTSNIEWGNTVLRENSAYAFDYSSTFQRINANIYGTYVKDFAENHSITATAGFERTSQIARIRNVEADELTGTQKEVGAPGNVQRVSNGEGSEIYFQGIFARLNYKFKDKYLLGLSYRYDGSSVFAPDNRFGSFPAISAGWIMTDEDFMDDSGFVNFLKLRGSFGQQGNSTISSTATFTTYTGWGRYGDVGAGDLLTGIGNDAVTWETQTATDVAVDFELWNRRISGSLGYYHQKVEDMLYREPIPVSSGIFSGAPTIWNNIGDMKNYGVEFNVNAVLMDKGDFKWDFGFNITTNKNEVIKLTGGADDELYNVRTNGIVTEVGESIGYFRLARYAGIHEQGGYEMIEEMDLDAFAETGERQATGNLIPATRSNLQRHLFDNKDKTNLPTFFGGFNTTMTWKGFDFAMTFSYQGGNYIYDNAAHGTSYIATGGSVLRSDGVIDTWTPTNTGANNPMLVWNRRYDVINDDNTISTNQRFDNQRAGQVHDKYLQKGDYLRLRALVLGWSLPTTAVNKIGLSKVRIYGLANNVFTITGYDGYDPEVVSLGDSQGRNISQGWIGTQLPQVQSFSIGLNVGF